MRYQKRGILCSLGLHTVDKEWHYTRKHYKHKNQITGHYAKCKRCGKKLYRTDRYGIRRIK